MIPHLQVAAVCAGQALITLSLSPPPPDSDAPAGLSLDFWSNLPLIACMTFFIVGLIGVIIIIRKNRSIAEEMAIVEQPDPASKDE